MQRKRKWPGEEKVTEAGIESFPASDPPAHNMAGRGARASAPAHHDIEERTRAAAHGFGPIALLVAAIGLTALVVWFVFR